MIPCLSSPQTSHSTDYAFPAPLTANLGNHGVFVTNMKHKAISQRIGVWFYVLETWLRFLWGCAVDPQTIWCNSVRRKAQANIILSSCQILQTLNLSIYETVETKLRNSSLYIPNITSYSLFVSHRYEYMVDTTVPNYKLLTSRLS
jgi:hypothetical protein